MIPEILLASVLGCCVGIAIVLYCYIALHCSPAAKWDILIERYLHGWGGVGYVGRSFWNGAVLEGKEGGREGGRHVIYENWLRYTML